MDLQSVTKIPETKQHVISSCTSMGINNFQQKQGLAMNSSTQKLTDKLKGIAHREDKGHFGGAAAAEIS